MFGLMFIRRTSSSRPCSRLSSLRKPPLQRNCSSKMSSDSHWLSPADRDQLVMELRVTGWMEVEDRDAIFKELHFKTFNQVCFCICHPISAVFKASSRPLRHIF
ncbi:hypothetical protein ATANTOWER_016199 [Ataeniobius toweri]|uniref:4a-hydroxytetrahydrobiopterin dehydratase n=1 Tax=Ataeniobius toweri TaxID=208326 RepID=A0ABU7APW9_9TELE|nr:hypothetical protein [Ataeniobius toweri]